MIDRLQLFTRVDNSQLIFFRICFGLLMMFESWGAIATGWVKRVFIDTQFTFTFIGFEWLQFLHGEIMYTYYIVMGFVAIAVMIGFRYRWTSVLLFSMWTATYLVQKSNYNNHYYLVVLLSGIMVFLPAADYNSWDARKGNVSPRTTCPRWIILFFIAQLWIIYTYASVAKIHYDWIQAYPASIWMQQKSNLPIIGPILALDWMPWFVAYGGIIVDGLLVPALLWKPSRKVGLIIGVGFHIFNSAVFHVGVFPYLMIGMMAFFFPAETVRGLFFKNKPSYNKNESDRKSKFVYVLGAYLILQILLPLRHHLYEGNSLWTEEGHRMSWRMMLRSKSGSIKFTIVKNESQDTLRINPRDYMTSKQLSAMSIRPDMTWQFVQMLKNEYANSEKETDISIYASGWARLNKRPSRPLIDPEYDLAKVEWHRFKHSPWLTSIPEMKNN